jgi:FkbM family methyltransferase
MLHKINTYFWYFYEYIKHGDLHSVVASARYLLYKKSHSNDRIITSSVGKFFCRKNTNDFQFANLRYEWGVKRFILSRIREYTVFVDAGSCIGAYSILTAKKKIKTIAFEPVESNYQVLVKNLALNNLENEVKAFKMGLGDQHKLVHFNFNQVNTGASHVGSADQQHGCQVELCTFDSLLPELNLDPKQNILFKLDVEGMEIEALQGAANFLRQYPNITLVVEEKITGQAKIKDFLNGLGSFEYGMIDRYNMFARKAGMNHSVQYLEQ